MISTLGGMVREEDDVIAKYSRLGILIVVLSVVLAKPARAVNPERVLIVVAAATAAAAIAAVVIIATVQHRHKKIVITGCVTSGENRTTLIDEEDGRSYTLSGETAGVKPGHRMKLQGKKLKRKRSNKTQLWETDIVVGDFGVCRP